MALKHRIDEPKRIVSVEDDAIDWERTPRLDYLESRDPDLVKTLPGRDGDLVWFTLRPLDSETSFAVKTLRSPHREWGAFQLSVQATSTDLGLQWRHEGGERVVERRSMGSLPDRVIEEIGAYAIRMGDLTEGES